MGTHINHSFIITLVFIFSLTVFKPALGEDLLEQGMNKFKGKIFGDQLILFDEMGGKTTARDGIYTTENGTKIIVKKGNIEDIPSTFKSMGVYSTFRIIAVEYFDSN